jgi:hypothetical protein
MSALFHFDTVLCLLVSACGILIAIAIARLSR